MAPKRSPKEQREHDLAVRRISRARFTSSPEWEAFTNPGDARHYGLVLADGTRCYPDIVARAKDACASCCVAEVETESTINEVEAAQWRTLAGLGRRFVLCVPAGSLLQAREICHRLKVRVDAYEVYELTPFWIRIRDFPV